MTSKYKYRLINPFVEGSMTTEVKAKNPGSAGKLLYGGLSKHFANHMKQFYMTIQNTDNDELHHLLVNEKRDGDEVKVTIKPLDGAFDEKIDKKLLAAVNNVVEMTGGSDDDSSLSDSSSDSLSSSSDSEAYRPPINRFIYYHLPYQKIRVIGISPSDLYKIYFPTFKPYLSPIVEVRFDISQYLLI